MNSSESDGYVSTHISDPGRFRNDTTKPHPLFVGMWATYFADQRWRIGIPKAGVIGEWIIRGSEATPPASARASSLSKIKRHHTNDGAMSVGM